MAVLESLRRPFRAVTTTVVPEAADLDAAGWDRLHAIVEDALAARPRSIRRQIGLFLRVLNWLPVVRYGRTFPRLDPDRRRAFLHALQNVPILKIRQGVWGLRTLAFMGFYGQPEVQRAIGYRAHLDGWKARLEGPDPERTEPIGVSLELRPPPLPLPGEADATRPADGHDEEPAP